MKWIGTQTIYDSVRFKKPLDIAGDVTLYQPVNNANPAFSIGSSDDERFRILINYKGTTTQEAQVITISSLTEGSTSDDGRFQFKPDESHVLDIDDGGIDFKTGFGISINGTDILTDSSGTATLSNIDAVDATTVSTLNAALTAGDITGVTAGTGLSGGGTSGAVTLNVDASQTQITSVGTIGTGTWQGTRVASLYLDADTAHLTTDQTFTGSKTMGTDVKLNFRDANAYINSPTANDLEIVATDIVLDASTNINLEADALSVDCATTIGGDLTVNSDTITLNSANADDPALFLNNTTDDDQASRIMFSKLRDDDAVAVGQNLGEIWFTGQDNAQNIQNYAYVIGEIDVSTGGQESGSLTLGIANHDGGVGRGLQLTGGSANNEIDVTVGLGASSVVTIPGDIDLAGDIDVDGTLEVDAFKGTGATTITNILDEDAMGTNSNTALATQQSIKAYADTKVSSDTTKQFTYHQFTDDTATTKIYLGLQEADGENTNTTNKFLPLVFPLAGKLLKVFLRSNKDLNAHTLTWRLETQATGVAFGTGPSVVGTQSGGGCTQLNMTTYDFTSSLDSGTNAIAANAMVYLSIQSDTDFGSNVIYYVTCLWEADLS